MLFIGMISCFCAGLFESMFEQVRQYLWRVCVGEIFIVLPLSMPLFRFLPALALPLHPISLYPFNLHPSPSLSSIPLALSVIEGLLMH